jgi:hypothetical protein
MRFSKNGIRMVLAGAVVLGLVGVVLAEGTPFIVESRSGGQHYTTNYSESATGWADSTNKSVAAGCTAGIGCRYSTVWSSGGVWYGSTGRWAGFSFTPVQSGPYNIYATWARSTNGYSKVDHAVEHDNGSGVITTTTVVKSHRQDDNLCDKWNLLGRFNLVAGTTYTVKEMATDQTGIPTTNSRIQSDAVYWAYDGPCASVPAVGVKIPVMTGDTVVTVTGIDPNATKVSVYLDGNWTTPYSVTLAGGGNSPATQNVTVPSLTNNQRVTATQTVPIGTPPVDTENCLDATGPLVDDCGQIPAVGVVAGCYAGATTVYVSGVTAPGAAFGNSMEVVVYAYDSASATTTQIGSTTSPTAGVTAVTGCTPLVAGNVIKAAQRLRGRNLTTGILGCTPAGGVTVDACAQLGNVAVKGRVYGGSNRVWVSGLVTGRPDVVAKAYQYDGAAWQEVGSANANGAAEAGVDLTTALTTGGTVKARQWVGTLGSCDASAPTRYINGVGTTTNGQAYAVVEDFEHTPAGNPNPGANPQERTWYWINGPGGQCYYPDAARSPWFDSDTSGYFGSTGSPSTIMALRDTGYTNGVYAKYEKVLLAGQTYHLEVDMLVNEANANAAKAGFRYRAGPTQSYMIGAAVNGAHRTADQDSYVAAIDAANTGQYLGLTTDQDGYGIDTAVQRVYTGPFTAGGQDSDLLIAFSSDLTSTDNKLHQSDAAWLTDTNLAVTTAAYMMVDNIRLVEGPPPCLPSNVTKVTVSASATAPLEDGGTKVRVTGIADSASLVTVYDYNADTDTWTKLGSVNPAGAANVELTLDAGKQLTAHRVVAATQTMKPCPWEPATDVEGEKVKTGPTVAVVGTGKPTSMKVTLGVREIAGTTCSLGTDGGIAGQIEWIGAATRSGGSTGAPLGHGLPTGQTWRTETFSSSKSGGTDPVLSAMGVGNGTLDGTCGTLEHLAFTIDPSTTNTGRYVVYVDNIKNGTTLITNFEDGVVDTQYIFRDANVGSTSGSTNPYILPAPVSSTWTTDPLNPANHCVKMQFQFRSESDASQWVRMTTTSTGGTQLMPNPVINLNQSVSMDLLLIGCNDPFADADGDGDVDQADFATFQACYTSVGGTYAAGCDCFDRDGDNDIDSDDLGDFEACASGPGIAADTGCD